MEKGKNGLKKPLGFVIKESLLTKFAIICRKKKTSMSKVLRSYVRKFVKDNEEMLHGE